MKTKEILITLLLVALVLVIPTSVRADDTKYTTSQVINGVTAQFEYKLDDNNQIIELNCTNASDLTGDITVPATLDGKTVVALGKVAFQNATNITGVTLPDSVKEIGLWAFKGCSNLSSVNLNKLEKISSSAFENCPSLKTVVIPKTLVNVAGGVFTGTTKLTSVTFEEGSTIIPRSILQDCTDITSVTIPNTVTSIENYAFTNSGITEITLPDSVKEVGMSSFEGCSNLSNVNLNKLEKISPCAFKDCPNLKTVVIPKTLVNGINIYIKGGIFSGTTKLTSVTFEEGSTVIAETILQDCTDITSVTIPNTVTLVDGYSFKNSGVKEITLPNSVEKIGIKAFEDCSDLTKITILDNCKTIGSDAFANHNEYLTIYCYEGSKAAEYAISHNIKYVYLTRDSENNTSNTTTNEQTTPVVTNTVTNTINVVDDTTATGKIPQTGATIESIVIITLVVIAGIIFYVKVNRYKEI